MKNLRNRRHQGIARDRDSDAGQDCARVVRDLTVDRAGHRADTCRGDIGFCEAPRARGYRAERPSPTAGYTDNLQLLACPGRMHGKRSPASVRC